MRRQKCRQAATSGTKAIPIRQRGGQGKSGWRADRIRADQHLAVKLPRTADPHMNEATGLLVPAARSGRKRDILLPGAADMEAAVLSGERSI